MRDLTSRQRRRRRRIYGRLSDEDARVLLPALVALQDYESILVLGRYHPLINELCTAEARTVCPHPVTGVKDSTHFCETCGAEAVIWVNHYGDLKGGLRSRGEEPNQEDSK